MADSSTCLMQPFSYASGITPNEASEGNPVRCLGHSVSFGRYMTESIAWEKWSSFSHNRYVEEAERYSKPGSVAQKKAFFEAHYKKVAAQRAQALLEQANANANANSNENENVVHAESDNNAQTKVPIIVCEHKEEEGVKGSSEFHKNLELNRSKVVMELSNFVAARKLHEKKQESPNREETPSVDSSGYNSSIEINCEKVHPVTVSPVHGDNYAVAQLPISTTMPDLPISTPMPEEADELKEVSGLELSATTQMEMPLLKENHSSNQEAPLPSRKKKPTTLPSSKSSLMYHKAPKAPSPPAKPTSSCFPRRDVHATPLHKKLASESEDKKRCTPKSLQKSVSFTPIREISRFTSTVMRKIENSRVGSSSFKTPRECLTPLKTPTMTSKNEVHNHTSRTPFSEKRRAKTPVTEAKSFGPNWHSFRTDCSKFLSACRNRAQSPFSSAPFSLRTEERAASRKKKLEEKFNADEAQKVQDKADAEIRKFRQTLCFKARPLPDFYKERKTPKKDVVAKVPLSQTQKVGKKPTPSRAISFPSYGTSIKSSGTQHAHIQGRNKRTPACSLISRSFKTAHENTSPNIPSS